MMAILSAQVRLAGSGAHAWPGVFLIDDEAFQATDVDRFVHLVAAAGALAAVIADAPADRREGVVLLDRPQCVLVAALADERDIALRALARRAGVTAGRDTGLLDGEGVWNRLRVEAVGSPLLLQSLVEQARQRFRADLGALAAPVADADIDVARLGADRCREGTGLAIERGDVAVGEDLDIDMGAGVDEARRNRAHRAVIGRKGLVELRHVAADRRLLLDQIDLVSRLGQIERGLHPGNAAAHHHHGADCAGIPRGSRLTHAAPPHPQAGLRMPLPYRTLTAAYRRGNTHVSAVGCQRGGGLIWLMLTSSHSHVN